MFSKLKAFFTKTYTISYYDFYISASLYNIILETEKDVNKKTISYFFTKSPYLLKKKHIHIIQQADKLFYIYIKFCDENKKENFKEEIEIYKELFPFWVVFPNNFYGAPRWNQGYQQQYRDVFIKYWKTLDDDAQEKYINTYNCPTEWRNWFKEMKEKGYF